VEERSGKKKDMTQTKKKSKKSEEDDFAGGKLKLNLKKAIRIKIDHGMRVKKDKGKKKLSGHSTLGGSKNLGMTIIGACARKKEKKAREKVL